MANKIFKSILGVAVSVLAACLLIVTGVLYQYFGSLQESQLKDELSLAASATEQLGESYLENLDSDHYRLTWVGVDGTVLYDSHAEINDMENHADREEIIEAFLSGKGSSVRESSTLTQQTIYEAVRLKDGSVLRISVSRTTAVFLVLGMVQPIAIVLIFSVFLSSFLAHHMAKRVVEPLNCLDLKNPMENDTYEELSPLLHRIHAQHQKINDQLKHLKDKQNEFEKITENMKEALVLLNQKGRIVSINTAALTLFDVSKDCVGNDFLTVDRKQEMRHAVQSAMETGYAYFYGTKNDRHFQFDISRIDSNHEVHGVVILAFDVTEQLNAQKHRQEFTANVSHELKTPLQSIIGSAELIENGIVKNEDIPQFIGYIHKEASRLVTLIDDIIRLSELDEKREMEMEDVSLRDVTEEVFETLSSAAEKKDISLHLEGEKGTIRGVRRLLTEMMYNLCDNAIKYSNTGGTVRVFITQTGNDVIVSVQDHGIGIAPEHQEKIFERFYRIDKSHSKQSGGTGLGLSIVKHAAEYHKGKIQIKSKLNKGTEISIRFEASPGEEKK